MKDARSGVATTDPAGTPGAPEAAVPTGPVPSDATGTRASNQPRPLRLLAVGATSAIVRATLAAFAEEGPCTLALAGRDADELAAVATDLAVRYGATCRCVPFEVGPPLDASAWLAGCVEAAGGALDGVIVGVGAQGAQAECERDPSALRQLVEVNFTACAAVLLAAAAYFEAVGGAGRFLCVISSVAGDRGRRSNYAYGATKAALSVFAEGLRLRMRACGARLVLVKPGRVDTRLTFGLDAPAAMNADPAAVGSAIHRAVREGRAVVYVPRFWRWVMLAVRTLPDALLARLPL